MLPNSKTSDYVESSPGRGLTPSPVSSSSPGPFSSSASGSTKMEEKISAARVDRTLRDDLNSMAELIANTTEAYTAAIFLARESFLELGGAHTLSREFNHMVKIGFGSGLVGWVAQNRERVSVSPFEHDSKTLLYYRTNQELKSFLAVPILDQNRTLLGVIACDSKKSFAFAKFAEKILGNCSTQIKALVELHRRAETNPKFSSAEEVRLLDRSIDLIREQESEQALFAIAADISESLIKRDALVVLALSEGGVGEGTFYSKANQSTAGNRLLDIVCKHKRIICGDRSVHALPVDDVKKRSFLSVPFHVLGREAGSFNLLSLPQTAFQASEIGAVEKIAKVFGRELERVRLKNQMSLLSEPLGLSSWESFAIQSKLVLREARERKLSATLLRIKFPQLGALEAQAGVTISQRFLETAIRLIHQVKRNDAVASAIYGPEILLLTWSDEAQATVKRLRAALARAVPGITASNGSTPLMNWEPLVELSVGSASYPAEGQTITELAAVAAAAPKLEERKYVLQHG